MRRSSGGRSLKPAPLQTDSGLTADSEGSKYCLHALSPFGIALRAQRISACSLEGQACVVASAMVVGVCAREGHWHNPLHDEKQTEELQTKPRHARL